MLSFTQQRAAGKPRLSTMSRRAGACMQSLTFAGIPPLNNLQCAGASTYTLAQLQTMSWRRKLGRAPAAL